jgi:RND family efflux transporter MFP subunit
MNAGRPDWLRWLLPVAVIALALLAAQVMIASREELPRRAVEPPAPLVDVMTVRAGRQQVWIGSQGTVRPLQQIDLVSEVSGRVVWVSPEFLTGARVDAGTTLLRIDPIDYELAVSEARSALASAELRLADARALQRRAAVDEAEAALRAARDRLRRAEADLAQTEISAPFAAVIDERSVDLGQFVGIGSPLMSLLGTELAEVRLPILPPDLPFVEHGRGSDGSWPRVVVGASFGGLRHEWQGRAARLENRVDPQTRVYYLVAQIEAPYDADRHGRALAVGQFVDARIEGRELERAFVVPRAAIHDGSTVYLLDENRLHRQPVTVARIDEGEALVTDGLADGDRIVVSRLDLMVEDMVVTATEVESP